MLVFRYKRYEGANWKFQTVGDCKFPLRHGPASAFDGEWLRIVTTGKRPTAQVRDAYAWDGATCAPDFKFTIAGSCLHDVLYQYAEAIATAWGWDVQDVLAWADDEFLATMLAQRSRRRWSRLGQTAIAMTYYAMVSAFGVAFHQAAKEKQA